jgi:hypothetical protein
MPAGVYVDKKKDNTEYYRVSITHKGKHISLGSFDDIAIASKVYTEAQDILSGGTEHFIDEDLHITSYSHTMSIPFHKYISLINFRDNGMYIKTPIYMYDKYFLYFLAENNVLIFSTDDLFYYSNHRIISRGGYYYVNDYGMQTSILNRYGIRAHAVKGRDYIHVNGDNKDYRYENVRVINRFNGVKKIEKKGHMLYQAYIHINGNFILGNYPNELTAAIAYNKAVTMLKGKTDVTYETNYIDEVTHIQYASIYNSVRLSKRFRRYVEGLENAFT